MKAYETVIGLEVHVELSTKTKIFCACSAAFGAAPNTHICPVCLGMPGTLPVLNRQVAEYALAVGCALHCEITGNCRFDRKNYFYPDNPQNYQISQLYLPICRGGFVELGSGKKIRIHEIHMEEDAGKLFHDEGERNTLVDYNRAGVPLLEIVSEPDLSDAEEVIAYLEKLKATLGYLEVSDCKMQEGSLRADVNLSVREKGSDRLGTRTEMKNLNSFHAIARAISNEKDRQITLLEQGEKVWMETRRWDDGRGESFVMRSKEEVKDYRYFPDPDLPALRISGEWIESVKAKLPELQEQKKLRYAKEYAIPAYDIEMITSSVHLARLFEKTVSLGAPPKKAANWIMGECFRILKEKELDADKIAMSPAQFAALIRLNEEGTITNAVAKDIFEKMMSEDLDPEMYAKEKGLLTVRDEGLLRKTVEEVLKANPKSVSDYRGGKKQALGYLVGQTMKALGGQADPAAVTALLKEHCDSGL